MRNRAERSRTRIIESRAIRVEARRDEPERLALILPENDTPVAPTNWSFGQLCSLVGAPASYMRDLASKDLQLKNAERGTVEKLDGTLATIRWDRDDRVQTIDLSNHKTWDHGYAETVYSAQSKTYDRVYVLAPINSGLVNGQNYYTAITRAMYGVKLWTEDVKQLAQRLAQRSGEKTSSLEALDRLDRDKHSEFSARHPDHLRQTREDQEKARQERRDAQLERQLDRRGQSNNGLAERLAGGARSIAEVLDRFLQSVLDRGAASEAREQQAVAARETSAPVRDADQQNSHCPER